MKILPFILGVFSSICVNAQGVAISSGSSSPDPSAMLDIQSTNKGLLPPRMTTQQMNTISPAATGLTIYNTDCNVFDYWNGGGWVAMGNIGSVSTPGSVSGNSIPCVNSTGISYSVTSVSGATSYNWIVPAAATVASGQGTNSITVNFGTTNGNVCVTAGNACGTSTVSCLAITLSTLPSSPVAAVNTASLTQVSWNWNSVAGATGYKWNTSDNYNTANDIGNNTTYTQTGLTCNTPYTLYVWAYNACGNSANATTLTQTTSNLATPAAATNTASTTQIVWTWNTVAGATGYKWNTSNNYNTANDIGNDTTYTQTGLNCSTAYTLYVWAYSSCGQSSNATLAQTTAACCVNATGGAITYYTDGNNVKWAVHTFTQSNCPSGCTFTPACSGNVYALVVGGGGGGGSGGGGAGGLIYNNSYAVTGGTNYRIKAGTGGTGRASENSGLKGDTSIFNTLIAFGGGGGGDGGSGDNGNNGGSGGGSGGGASATNGGTAVAGQGNNGGNVTTNLSSPYPTGGGGGAGGTGGAPQSGTQGGIGGAGMSNSITGSAVIYAAGGGGGTLTGSGSAGAGGSSGVGGNGTTNGQAGSGAANTGSGGGGGSNNFGGTGGNGANGIVIISYPSYQ